MSTTPVASTAAEGNTSSDNTSTDSKKKKKRLTALVFAFLTLPLIEPLFFSACIEYVPGADEVLSVEYPQELLDRREQLEVLRPSNLKQELVTSHNAAKEAGLTTYGLYLISAVGILYLAVMHLIPGLISNKWNWWYDIQLVLSFVGCLVWLGLASWFVGGITGANYEAATKLLPTYQGTVDTSEEIGAVIRLWPEIDTAIYDIDLGWFEFLLPLEAGLLSIGLILAAMFSLFTAFGLFEHNWKKLLSKDTATDSQ